MTHDSGLSSGSHASPIESNISYPCSSGNEVGLISHRPIQVPIAVVGMGCRLPGHSNSPTKLWELLEKGGVAKNEPPPSRFNLDGHYDKTNPGRPRTMKSPGGMFLEGIDPALFDGQFFNISRTECIAMDPQQRQTLEVAYECLENAGIPIETLSGTNTGVIVGTNFIDYGAIQHRDPEDTAESITIGLATALLSNRVSHFLNIHGPSMTVDTACSAGMVSLDVACRYLDSHQADAMLVGGANLWLTPEHNEEVGMMHVTQSGSGRCKSFDASADGYVKAEGVNCFFLKRLHDAVRDGDPIRSIIRGTAVNASGRTNGIANPSEHAQAAVTRQAFQNAGIGPDEFIKTQYLECHGTGTLAGDPIEVRGAASVFSNGRKDGQELVIGSVKSNIGHSEPAAGLSGLLKATLALEKGTIPGTPTFFAPNPNIDWKTLRVKASRISMPWPTPGEDNIRRAGVNSFGFGGANAHVVVENDALSLSRHISSYKQLTSDFFDDSDDEDKQMGTPEIQNAPTLLYFSANDQWSLISYIKTFNAHLQNPLVSIELSDLAYTLSERRSRHYHGAFAITRSSLKSINQNTLIHGKKSSTPPRIAFVFTGQGAQWSKMGAGLIESFPRARATIEDLDKVLQSLSNPPSWSLLEELSADRSAETLRQPEFSQPLVTALQIALIQVLADWEIRPEAVVGHSSGEIGAAFAAGFISSSDAIKAAFYRGQSSKLAKGTPAERVGMLAVGVGEATLETYLKQEEIKVQIACYNSPSSLTLSGTVPDLEKLRDTLKTDGHFARLLLVDLAYHSSYMKEIGNIYEETLLRNGITSGKDNKSSKIAMFSSVTGTIVDPDTILDAKYWKTNMVSPVKFSTAMTQLLKQSSADFLIEVGPTNALAGPVAQIKKSIGKEGQYTSALKRGDESTLSMYEAAGRLYLAGDQNVSLAKVNGLSPQTSRVVTDLPNYVWNHSTRYWHETRASKEWRFKRFINHDLIGSKMSSVGWQAPVFKGKLKLANLPWLRDHKLGNDVVFPAAGYVAMAVEAIFQTTMMTKWKEQAPSRYRFRLRDVRLLRALVLAEESETRVSLALTPVKGGSTRSWYEYQMCSEQEGIDVDFVHSTGLVCVETDYQETFHTVAPLELATSARIWYKTLAEMGYNFGPSFQKHLMVESTMGQRQSRSTVNLEPPLSHPKGQSSYPLHPAVIDGCFQAATPSLWKGLLPQSGDRVLVPKTIDSIVIESGSVRQARKPTEGIALAAANFVGVGNSQNARNYTTNVDIFDPLDGALLFQMKGLASAEMETSAEEKAPHQFMHATWNADINMIMGGELSSAKTFLSAKTFHHIIDLVAHKNPGLSVFEVNLNPSDGSSLWMDQEEANPVRAGCSKYHFAVRDPKILIQAEKRLGSRNPRPQFHLLMDITKPPKIADHNSIDLAIVNANGASISQADAIIDSIAASTKESGFIVSCGLPEIARLGKTIELEAGLSICSLQQKAKAVDRNEVASVPINLVTLLGTGLQEQFSKEMLEILDALTARRWNAQRRFNPLSDISSSSNIVLVIDELFVPIMDRVDDKQWKLLHHLTKVQCPLLWITSRHSNPTTAASVGFLASIRAEEQVPFFTLDVESHDGNTTIEAISTCIRRVKDLTNNFDHRIPKDYDFIERSGIVHTSRIYSDLGLTLGQSDELSDRLTETVDLHQCDTLVQLRCERLGNLDALHFAEADATLPSLSDGMIEVEIYAAGLNYKDVVVTAGIIPGDETALGHEAAGVVRKMASGVPGLSVGDRVVVFGKGCFANRIQTSPARVHRIPDSMTFEEAATLPIVYLTGIHSLLDHGSLEKGKSLLIHSAAGGVGIAAIQLAQYIGAEIFVTVSTPEKKEFLKSAFGLADDRIFNSRNTEFGDQILSATSGRGMDVVLNSLVGDMLDESFRILADGGIMVELGKRDVLDRNNLPMAPFDRNTTFRAVDLSPEKASDALISRLMSKLFELIDRGFLKPITPIHHFSWTEIPAAFRFLRPGNHIGKVVLSEMRSAPRIEVPIRRAPKNLGLRSDGCYLIVSSLRGLCGSLAIYLAQQGAKHLAVMSRSGHADNRSKYVIKQINALGAHIDLLTADVTVEADVLRSIQQTTAPIIGIIQGAMVLRDRPFESMSLDEYHEAFQCKVQGTWNLHNASESLGLKLDSFTLLSSLSGIIGHAAQANYAAGNVFLDGFAAWRQALGKPACSIDLGISEDSGVIFESAKLQDSTDSQMYKGLNESQLKKILYFALLRQKDFVPLKIHGSTHELIYSPMITGLTNPQPSDSVLKTDARFSPLFNSQRGPQEQAANSRSGDGSNTDVQTLFLLLRTEAAEPAARLKAVIDVINGCFMRVLRLAEPMDPGRPISVYGTDSLAAVEVRNWIRTELGCLVTTLDIMNASSLTSFCENVLRKLLASTSK